MKRFTLPKSKRLVRNSQFKDILGRGMRFSNCVLTVYMAKNDCGYPRLGVSVGKFWGGAVMRNRLKRLLREAFRQSQDQIPADFDYLLMFSRSEGRSDKAVSKETSRRQPTFEQIRTSLPALAKRGRPSDGATVKQ